MPNVVPELLRFGGKAAEAGGSILRRVVTSTPGKILGAGLALGATGVAVGAGVHAVKQGWSAPASESTLDVLTHGVTPEDSAKDAQVRKDQTPTPAEFLTSWQGLLMVGVVGAIVLVVLLRRK